MTKKRHLSDLFVVGKEIVFDDGRGEPVTIWMQKLNPVEHETAMRRAAAARAKVSAGKNEAEIELVQHEAESMGRDGWLDFLSADAISKRLGAIEAELAAEEEWSENDYLQGLRDVWRTTYETALDIDPDDEQALQVKQELERFRDLLEKRIDGERASMRADYDAKADEDLERRVVDRLLSARGDMAWLHEFRRCEIWLSVRDPDDHRKGYFDHRDEVDDLSQDVLLRLLKEYSDLNVEPLEGKDSRVTPSSSSSSGSPEPVETVEASGRLDVETSLNSPTI